MFSFLEGRTSWRTVSSALGLILALAAVDANAQTIRMWTFLDPSGQTGREIVLKKLIESFEAENPGVNVQVEPQVWQQLSDKFLAAHQTGNAPDVVWMHSSRVMDGIQLGALANLDELFVKNWSEEEIEDIDGALWRYGATSYAHYHIMHSLAAVGQFYRTDLFEEAGIDPASLTTWDKFIEAAQKLTERDASGKVVRWGYGHAYPTVGSNSPIMVNVMLEEQGNIFDENGQAVWATPAGVKGLQLQLDMIRQYRIVPDTAVSLVSDDVYDQFSAGRTAIVRGSSVRLPRAMDALGADNVGYLRTPSFTEGKYAPAEVVGWSVGVWEGSEHKELAGRWVEYMSSKEADALWTIEAGMIPIRKSTITEHPEFFGDPKNAFLAVAAEDLNGGWLAPAGVKGGYYDELNRAFQDVFINNTDPMTALKNAETAYNRKR